MVEKARTVNSKRMGDRQCLWGLQLEGVGGVLWLDVREEGLIALGELQDDGW